MRRAGYTGDQGIRCDVRGDDGPGGDGGPRADPHRRHAHGARTDRGPSLDDHPYRLPVSSRLQVTLRGHSPRVRVVGEDRGGTDEDTVGQLSRLVDESVVLALAVLTHAYAGADVGPLPMTQPSPSTAFSRTWARCQIDVRSPMTALSWTSAVSTTLVAMGAPVPRAGRSSQDAPYAMREIAEHWPGKR